MCVKEERQSLNIVEVRFDWPMREIDELKTNEHENKTYRNREILTKPKKN